jgi:hypothetical protein
MQKAVLILLLVALGVSSAQARHRHHRHHRGGEVYPQQQVIPLFGRQSPSEYDTGLLPVRLGFDAGAGEVVAGLLPQDWRLMPADPNWKGLRYVSPDGSSWVALYATQVGEESLAAHMKAVAFVDGEQMTYVRGERDWLVVSGLKDDRVFYRKAALACGGHSWHHVAFEYPVDAKRKMDAVVMRLARGLDRAGNVDCQPAVVSQ